MPTFVRSVRIQATAERVWAFHALPDAMVRLSPPGAGVRIIQAAASLEVGATALIDVRLLPGVWSRWLARHTVCEPPTRFVDVMVRGPFARWEHQHLIRDLGDGSSELTDRIDWQLPWWQRLAAGHVAAQLERTFAHRHAVTRAWCEGGADGAPGARRTTIER